MGLAVFGEKVAARTYMHMAELKPEFGSLLRSFAQMEAQHGTWFTKASRENGAEPNREFADRELGYLISQVDEHRANRDFDALAVVQGFIVESLAIATYEPFLDIAHRYPGTHEVFAQAARDEHYHVDWVIRYLRLQFFDRTDDFLKLCERVNVQGVDCVGGTMMNIAEYLGLIGLSGADCAGRLMDGYTGLLEQVGLPLKDATANVVSLFVPLIRKYRRGEKTK
jgi:rubrerythrin